LSFPARPRCLQLTGQPLQSKRSFGKPNAEPYRLVEAALEAQALALGLPRPPPRKDALGALLPPFQAIYAVGDNPAADVRGANAAGHPWVSVLVRTGVFAGPPGANCHVDPAHIVVDDVEGAVDAALHRARSDKWHSMR
jgi:ribonucleotide monophosphatase NagD (HAD superfamily)